MLAWLLRLAWVGVGLLGSTAVDQATLDTRDTVRAVAMFGCGFIWLVGVAAMALASVVNLTAVRITVPLSIVCAAALMLDGADSTEELAFCGAALLASALAFNAEVGRIFVQASAYGSEDRFPLRPPAAYAIAAVMSWIVWAVGITSGPLLLAFSSWFVGGIVSVFAAVTVIWSWPRWHRLSRRWLVIVPVGVVIHDQVVLAETLMLRRHDILALRLAPTDTEAADLTGPASGHAIEIVTHESVTAILAASPKQPRGTAIHLTACLVSPTRPGHVLAAALSGRLPVG